MSTADKLAQALRKTIDAMWLVDSHEVRFDDTVFFGPSYDFSGLTGTSREEFLAEYECVVWKSGGKWSAYCTHEGTMWFERFDSVDDAKEQCMALLDKVMPDHPAMQARAALAAHEAEKAAAAAPVAWVYRGEDWFDGTAWHRSAELTTCEKVARFKDKNCRPLYSEPTSAPAAPVAVPLTDADILFKTPFCPVESEEQLIRFARAIERECAARWGIKLEGGE